MPFLITRAARIFPVFLLVFALPRCSGIPGPAASSACPGSVPTNAARTICVMAGPHGWLAEIVAHLTMTHGLFPDGVLTRCLGQLPWVRLEPFDRVAILCSGAVGGGRQPAPVLVAVGLAVAGIAWRLAAPEAWQFSRAFLPNKAHFFALGVASVAVVRRERGALPRYGAGSRPDPGDLCDTGSVRQDAAASGLDGLPGRADAARAGRLAGGWLAAAKCGGTIPRGDFVLPVSGQRADPQADRHGAEPRWPTATRRCSRCYGCRRRSACRFWRRCGCTSIWRRPR